ncbi:MAG TPA: hypothetical protein EYG86_03720 [Crocinitomicaceae bacterium]|nr:hypothetical protein [Crocinitomicaceae bacterium]
MSNFLDMLDKYKFGLLASLGTYIFIFMYLQLQSFQQYVPYDPFYDGSYVEIPKEEIRLKPENIMLPSDQFQDVKNMARDANDSREKSYEEYYENASDESVMDEYKKLEQEMYEEAGGEKTRAEIREEMSQRQKEQAAQVKNENRQVKQEAGSTAYAGNVMVDWVLENRNPHQNNNWYVRNPGYTCGYGSSGVVTVLIKVNQNGNVSSATYDASQSSGENSCMIQQAVAYAKKSRFNFANSKIQEGRITYTFIAQ